MSNFSDMLSKAKKMQEKMKEVQDLIRKIEVQGQSGGNLVKVTLTGEYELKSIELSDEAKKEKQEMKFRLRYDTNKHKQTTTNNTRSV